MSKEALRRQLIASLVRDSGEAKEALEDYLFGSMGALAGEIFLDRLKAIWGFKERDVYREAAAHDPTLWSCDDEHASHPGCA